MRRAIRGWTAAAGVLLALASLTAAGAQQDGGLFYDTVDVRVVNVEVLVTDKAGNPVTDLRQDEFEVFEDGRRVEITNFFAVRGRKVVRDGGEAERASDVVAQELYYAPETRRLNLILFVDNLNMRPENRNLVFHELAEHLRERLDPRDRVMVVSLGRRLEIVQPFTNDPGLLLRTLDELEMRTGDFLALETEQRSLLRSIQGATLPENPFRQSGGNLATENWEAAQQIASRLARQVERLAEVRVQRVRDTVEAIGRFSDSLAGMQGRKAVLYVSDGLPLRPADAPAQAWLNKFDNWIVAQDARDARAALQDMTVVIGSPRYDASRHFDRLVDRASANGVVFYPLSNPRNRGAAGISAEFQAAGTSTGKGAFSSDVAALESISLESSLLQMADGTGGTAFTRTRNIERLLDNVSRDFDSFYSLGYEPPTDDGEIHEIEVKVSRPGVTVRHVGAHRERSPVDHLKDLTLSALQFDLTDNALEVELDPGQQVRARGKRYQLEVMVKVPFRNVLLLPDEEYHVGQLTLIVAVRDEEGGGTSEPQQIVVPLQVPNAEVVQAVEQFAAYPLRLELERGRKRISVGVRDELARVESTVNLEVAVGGAEAAESPVSEG